MISADLKMFILQFAIPTLWASNYNALYNYTKAAINAGSVETFLLTVFLSCTLRVLKAQNSTKIYS
jgi:hypothetical protein